MTAYTLSEPCVSRGGYWIRGAIEMWTRGDPDSPTYEQVLKVSCGESPLYTEEADLDG